jgi:hypothetical protein
MKGRRGEEEEKKGVGKVKNILVQLINIGYAIHSTE